ncbi:MAG: hypothetical protein PF638_16135 [Candidatus Delongbacteria bacterium]|jgi:hypothetical protein|nr:hypothetical protein [Candidatus Delongbacteria bacterium]
MTSQEKLNILKMLEEKKITPEQAANLLSAVDGVTSKPEPEAPKAGVVVSSLKDKKLKGKFKVEVKSADGDNVMITLPLMLAKLAINMVPAKKLAGLNQEGVDLENIINHIQDFADNIDDDIVNVTSADGDHVRIYIEK